MEPGDLDPALRDLPLREYRPRSRLRLPEDRGLHVWDDRGELLLPDDERLSDVGDAAGELGLPVLIHTADPVAFFDPVDRFNERLEELLAHPDWSFADPGFPRFERLIDPLEAVVASHPRTAFVGAHVGCYAEDLAWVGRMLHAYPNPDRILFGIDDFPKVYAENARRLLPGFA